MGEMSILGMVLVAPILIVILIGMPLFLIYLIVNSIKMGDYPSVIVVTLFIMTATGIIILSYNSEIQEREQEKVLYESAQSVPVDQTIKEIKNSGLYKPERNFVKEIKEAKTTNELVKIIDEIKNGQNLSEVELSELLTYLLEEKKTAD